MLDALGLDYVHKAGWQKVRCYFHDETVPSMTLNVDEGGWNCFACGAKGKGPVSLLMALEHIEFIAAKKRLEELTGHALQRGGQEAQVRRVASGGVKLRFKR